MKKIFIFALALVLPFSAFATDANEELYLNIRRIGLDLSKTDVRHASEYTDSPIQAFTAADQEFIKGVFDTALEYDWNRLSWDNGLFMEYGRTTLRPYNEPKSVNENADKILFTSDLSYAVWDYDSFKLGPMVRAAYETEFDANDPAPLQKIFRTNAGIAMFDHAIIKSLYLSGVYEYDFTYGHHQVSKLAAELGWRVEYDVRDGVKLGTNGYYREYLDYSEYVPTDLERDFSAVVRMDTNLWGDFTMGPYAQYRRARARGADHYASNFIIGISFNYITKFGLITLPDSTDE